jgi:hypothetical protein
MRISVSLPLAAAGIVTASAFLASCSSASKSEVVVSVKDQKLGVYEGGRLKKQYLISTSKFGLGDKPNSYCTPLGKHEVIAKIGHGLPKGAVLKSRSWNGEVLKPNAPGRDPIVSRILWLRGLEKENKNAQNRFIYIHGTTEENNLGRPASYGCIRMGMGDVVEVFNEVSIGAKVVVTKGGLPRGGAKTPAPAEELPLPAEAKEPILIAGGTGSSPAQNASAADAKLTPPTPVEAAPAVSKGVFGLFGKKTPKVQAEPVAADAPAAEPDFVASAPVPGPKVKGKKASAEGQPKQVKIGPEVPSRDRVATKPAPAKATANKRPARASKAESAS